MRSILVAALFMLAMLVWAAAQQPGGATERNSGQTASPSSQAPGEAQTQPSTPDGAGQSGSQGQASNAPVTEGCLGGSDPNYTLTDKTGTAYKLNMPPNANTSKLASHVGESVEVQGDVKDTGNPGKASIDVQAMSRGTGNCPGGGSRDAQPPPKE